MSFKRFDTEDIALSADSVVAPAWSNQTTTLTTMGTGAQIGTSTGKYYYNIYTTATDSQFSTAYGNTDGSGSVLITSTEIGKSPLELLTDVE